MAVIVEGGGYGSRSAAPIAAQLVLRARDLGLLGGVPKNAPKNPNEANTNRQRPRSRTTRR
jgi:hypothetical protein